MSSKSLKGYRVVQKTENGKIKITMERIPFYGLDSSAKIKKRKSKRVRVQRPQLVGLFSPAGKP